MKVDFKTLQSITRDLKVIVELCGYMEVFRRYKDNKVATAHTLWHGVYCNRRYPSDNPNVKFIGLKRVLPYTPDFERYPCDTKDDTLKTALIKALDSILID